jgi:hypothetical protein
VFGKVDTFWTYQASMHYFATEVALLTPWSSEGAYTSSTMWVNRTTGAKHIHIQKIIHNINFSKAIIRTYCILVRVKPVAWEAWTSRRSCWSEGRVTSSWAATTYYGITSFIHSYESCKLLVFDLPG